MSTLHPPAPPATTLERWLPWLILGAILAAMIVAGFVLATHGGHPVAATYFDN